MPLTFRAPTIVVVSYFLVMSALVVSAQVKIEIRPQPIPRAELSSTPSVDLRVDSSLALIPAHVTTLKGAPVTDLNKHNFRLFEEGVEQKITYFAKDDVPVSIGLVFDSSASMQNKKHKVAEAVATFFRTASAQDEFFLVQFDERPRLAVALHSSFGRCIPARPAHPALWTYVAAGRGSPCLDPDENRAEFQKGAGDSFRWRGQS